MGLCNTEAVWNQASRWQYVLNVSRCSNGTVWPKRTSIVAREKLKVCSQRLVKNGAECGMCGKWGLRFPPAKMSKGTEAPVRYTNLHLCVQ